MNAAASTYAALFQAVSGSGVVKTAEINWKKTLGWGLGVPAAAAGAYGLYRMAHPSSNPALGAAAEPDVTVGYPEEYYYPSSDEGYDYSYDPTFDTQEGWYA